MNKTNLPMCNYWTWETLWLNHMWGYGMKLQTLRTKFGQIGKHPENKINENYALYSIFNSWSIGGFSGGCRGTYPLRHLPCLPFAPFLPPFCLMHAPGVPPFFHPLCLLFVPFLHSFKHQFYIILTLVLNMFSTFCRLSTLYIALF